MKAKKSRTAKMYTVNIERKGILQQRREQTLQTAKDRKLAKEYFITASQASRKAHRTLKDTQKGRKSNNGLINGDNTNTTTLVDNINNLEIVADNVANATTNVESIDTEFVNTDNINNAEIENDKSKDENSTEDVPSPLIYGRKTTNPTKVRTSKRHRPVMVKPLESPMDNSLQIKQPLVKQKVMHLILLMCEYMNSSFKVHETLKI